MKRYKLKRDLPTFRAGDLFELRDDGCLYWVRGWRNPDEVKYWDKEVIAYRKNTLEFFPNILTDWFEEIKESTRWKPEKDKTYYFISNDGKAMDDMWFYDSGVDHNRFKIGNCFLTEKEAKRVVEYLKALATVRGDATTKFVNGEYNWYVYFDIENGLLLLDTTSYSILNGVFGLPYFATEEDAKRSIKQHKNEWLTIFGVKEKLCD